MKTDPLFCSCRIVELFLAVLFCLSCPINAQEPKPAGSPTVNPDGSTTETQPVDFGKSNPDSPFKGKGEKLTTRDKDGNVMKVEWVKKGVVRRAVFIEKGSETTTVTAYDYQSDGKTPVSKSEHSFGNNDGKLRSQERKTYRGGGQVKGGTRYRFENGEWVSEDWDPETETWGRPARVAFKLIDLKDVLNEYGIELEEETHQVSGAGVQQGYEHAMREVQQPTGRLSVTVGALAESSNVHFSFSHKAEDFGLVSAGSTDFFIGDGTVSYADGTVSFDAVSDPLKLAPFTGGSVQSTGTGMIGSATVDTIDVAFHSTVISEIGRAQSRDESFGKYAPYIQLSYKVAETNWGSVSVFSQYAFYDKNQSSGAVDGVSLGDFHTFVYQGIDQMTGPDLVVYDPTVLNNAPFNANPPFAFPVDMISALRVQSSGELDLQQHVFTLGVRTEMAWDRYHFFAAVGPTLTHSCVDFKARSDLWMGDVRVATHEFSDSSHDFQLGFMFQTGVEIDLWRNVSLEVFGRYDWSDKLEVGDEQARAELGNNSIGGGAGIKFTF